MSISSQGNLKTMGSLIIGGENSGSNIWSLNAKAESWKINYGKTKDANFFGVALPFGGKEWERGIRFNGYSRSILLNGSGIRFYNWGTKSTVVND
jgi:hypothetical protein